MDLRKLILKEINETLNNLEWQCKGCWRMDGCDELNSGGRGKRYCREILDAAILNSRTFYYVEDSLDNYLNQHCDNCSHLNEPGNPTWCASCKMSNFYPNDLPI